MNEKLNNKELKWSEGEYKHLMNKIINFDVDQLVALLNLVGLDFKLDVIELVAKEIKKNKKNRGIFLF